MYIFSIICVCISFTCACSLHTFAYHVCRLLTCFRVSMCLQMLLLYLMCLCTFFLICAYNDACAFFTRGVLMYFHSCGSTRAYWLSHTVHNLLVWTWILLFTCVIEFSYSSFYLHAFLFRREMSPTWKILHYVVPAYFIFHNKNPYAVCVIAAYTLSLIHI